MVLEKIQSLAFLLMHTTPERRIIFSSSTFLVRLMHYKRATCRHITYSDHGTNISAILPCYRGAGFFFGGGGLWCRGLCLTLSLSLLSHSFHFLYMSAHHCLFYSCRTKASHMVCIMLKLLGDAGGANLFMRPCMVL